MARRITVATLALCMALLSGLQPSDSAVSVAKGDKPSALPEPARHAAVRWYHTTVTVTDAVNWTIPYYQIPSRNKTPGCFWHVSGGGSDYFNGTGDGLISVSSNGTVNNVGAAGVLVSARRTNDVDMEVEDSASVGCQLHNVRPPCVKSASHVGVVQVLSGGRRGIEASIGVIGNLNWGDCPRGGFLPGQAGQTGPDSFQSFDFADAVAHPRNYSLSGAGNASGTTVGPDGDFPKETLNTSAVVTWSIDLKPVKRTSQFCYAAVAKFFLEVASKSSVPYERTVEYANYLLDRCHQSEELDFESYANPADYGG